MPCRTAADWGNLGDATKALVQAALEDPLNQRFLLTSDSDMPLYPAPALWLQLMHEHTSRVDACNADQASHMPPGAAGGCRLCAAHTTRGNSTHAAWARNES